MGAGQIDQYGKNYQGLHTGNGWYKYNMHAVANYKESFPTNKQLVEGLEVYYIGQNKLLRNVKGVIIKKTKKVGRSWHPIKFEIFDKHTSKYKNIIVYCTKEQLQMPIILKSKSDKRTNNLRYKEQIRKRKKEKYRQQKLDRRKN